MKRTLIEELKRIHSITYGNQIIEEGFVDNLLQKVGLKKQDDPKKADLVSDDVQDFFNTLESIDSPIFQQKKGGMEYQKNVEVIQISLLLLGYQLPKYGVDGLFGPETSNAIQKFKSDNRIKPAINEATLESPIDSQGVSSQYGVTRSTGKHLGVDLKASSGTEVKSPADGKVLNAEFSNGACGGTIQIEHGGGFVSRYCHMKDIKVSKGQEIKQGSIIGHSGGAKGDKGAGRSSGPHLHFELKKNGSLVNPMDYIGSNVGTYDLNKKNVTTTLTNVSPEDVKVIISKLKQRGVKSSELKGVTDSVVTGHFTPLDLSTDEGYQRYSQISQKFIDSRRPNPLNISGEMLAIGAKNVFVKYGKFVPAELALSQLTIEGGIGNGNLKSRPIKTKNPFNVGNVDNGKNKYNNDVQSGINAYFELIARNYLDKGKTANDLINNFVNKSGNRYASAENYEKNLNVIAKQANSIARSIT